MAGLQDFCGRLERLLPAMALVATEVSLLNTLLQGKSFNGQSVCAANVLEVTTQSSWNVAASSKKMFSKIGKLQWGALKYTAPCQCLGR